MTQRRESAVTEPAPDLSRGDRVVIEEPGLDPWQGEVLSVKRGAQNWRVEVRNAKGLAWSLPAAYVRKEVTDG